jgi:hypothetical protein
MIKRIFEVVVKCLMLISEKSGLSYWEINIIAYFGLIPFSWMCLMDMIFEFHYLKGAFLIFLLGFVFGCRDFKSYSISLFKKSVDFLIFFNKFGSNYVLTSVVICVVLPILIYASLFYFALK